MISMCGVQLKDRKRSTDYMLMLGLKETIDQLAMANYANWLWLWHGHVLRREEGHIVRRALDFEVEGQRKKGRSKEKGEAKGKRGGKRKKGRPREKGEAKGKRGGQRKKGRSKEKGRPKKTWKKQVEEESVKVGLRRKNALYRSKWSAGVNKIAAGLR